MSSRNSHCLRKTRFVFAGTFGDVSQHLRPDALRNKGVPAANPAGMMVTNERKDGKPVGYLPDGEIFYNTASCYMETGGDPIFASACRIYETLPADL